MYYFIINPAAGNGMVIPLMNRLKQQLQHKEILGEIAKTTSKGDAVHLARIAVKKGYSTIIAVGGDYTVHEVLNGITGAGVVLGIIPTGVNNFLAKRLGISMNWKESIDNISSRRVVSIDIGRILELKTYFFLSACVGDPVNKDKNKFKLFKRNTYKNIFKNIPFNSEFVIDRSYRVNSRVVNISAVNAGFSKDIIPMGAKFNVQDKLLDFVIISYDGKSKNILGVNKNIFENISRIKGREIHIESAIRKDVYADGQLVGKTPVTFSIAPFSQKVIVGAFSNS